jgi:hypothetical protein
MAMDDLRGRQLESRLLFASPPIIFSSAFPKSGIAITAVGVHLLDKPENLFYNIFMAGVDRWFSLPRDLLYFNNLTRSCCALQFLLGISVANPPGVPPSPPAWICR